MKVSIIIPAHNEEEIIRQTVLKALNFLNKNFSNFELLIIENGSVDQTLNILKKISRNNKKLVVKTLPVGNKGLALKTGMEDSKGEFLILLDADLWDEDFVKLAMENLKNYDIVIGSKSLKGAKDQRALVNRLMSKLYNLLFKIFLGFKGTETHAKLAFKRAKILPIVKLCLTDGLVFDTELIIRAQRQGLSKLEVPTKVSEIRARTFSVSRNFGSVAKNFFLLLKVLGHG